MNSLFCDHDDAEEAEEEARNAASQKVEAAPTVSALPPKAPLPDIRYQYYQSATSMNISVMAKDLTPQDVTVEFSPQHLLVRVKQAGKDGKIEVLLTLVS